MKAFTFIVKILTALSAVVGGIYILATYGEQIVAWCKKAVDSAPETLCKCKCDAAPVEEASVEEVTAEEEAPAAEEAPVEEVPVAAEEPAEETAPVIVVAENEPVAEESDFAE